MSEHWYSSIFDQRLADLGFRGVLTPESEIGRHRGGVNATFLENAEAYYNKYQGFDYWRMLLRKALDHAGADHPATIVEYGCVFGNGNLADARYLSRCQTRGD